MLVVEVAIVIENKTPTTPPSFTTHTTFSSTLANGSSNEIIVGLGVDGKVDGSELGEDVSRLLDAGKEGTDGSEELGLGDGDERGQMILPGLGKTSGAGKRQW
jgi:hypothetical protein